ncbi:hypothetical protein CTM88_03155 [Photobacterium aquimaris]|uniref:Lipoprotein n=1 Tax=Photobacterium aquimaris TaxID=512643 RepID=A0A2T3IQJ1_9GAMM|nr:hypothetical protein [Photobacterium aquimaris]OBU17056.1 hypothetical protein AYY20_05300 [Photobacterium aquimaris]PSU30619.1 hypothetical protein CTM88_03155 [Photobacterium aquimaris]
MNKFILAAFITTTLFGCNSNDGEDIIVDKVGLDISALTEQQKQDYAQISTDINAFVLYVAGTCVDKQEQINADFTTLRCNIADHLTDIAKTEYSTITLVDGKLDITRENNARFIIKTDEDVKFKAPTISSDTLRYRLSSDNSITVQISGEDEQILTTSFRGFYTDGSLSDNGSWTTESIKDQSFIFTDDENTQLIALTEGQAKLIGKDEKSYSWSTDTMGKVVLK